MTTITLLTKQREYDKLGSVPRCPICNEYIYRNDVGMCEMVKTRRKTTIFIHKLCTGGTTNEN